MKVISTSKTTSNSYLNAFVVLCLINVSIVSIKSCEISTTLVVDKQRVAGRWFMHQVYAFPGAQEYDCFVLLWTLLPDRNMDAAEVLVKPGVLLKLTDGQLIFNHTEESRFTYASADNLDYNGNEYVILAANYNEYIVVYGCTDESQPELYVLTRLPSAPQHTQNQINDKLIIFGFDLDEIRTTNTSSCPKELTDPDGLFEGLLKLVARLGGLLGGLLGG